MGDIVGKDAGASREVMGKQVGSVFLFPNGNAAVCDNEGQQVPELQTSWLLLFFEFLQKNGVKVEEIGEINLPNGKQVEYLKDVHNWRIR